MVTGQNTEKKRTNVEAAKFVLDLHLDLHASYVYVSHKEKTVSETFFKSKNNFFFQNKIKSLTSFLTVYMF